MSLDNIARISLINNQDGTWWCQAVHIDASVIDEASHADDPIAFIERVMELLMLRLVDQSATLKEGDPAGTVKSLEAREPEAPKVRHRVNPNSPRPRKRRNS